MTVRCWESVHRLRATKSSYLPQYDVPGGVYVVELGISFRFHSGLPGIYVYIYMRMEVQRHVQCNMYIYMYHMYFGSRIKRLEKVRFPFRRYAAYGPSVIASNFAD